MIHNCGIETKELYLFHSRKMHKHDRWRYPLRKRNCCISFLYFEFFCLFICLFCNKCYKKSGILKYEVAANSKKWFGKFLASGRLY